MGLFDIFKKKEDKFVLDNVPEAKIFECFMEYLPKKWKKFAMFYITSGNMMTYKFWVDCGRVSGFCCRCLCHYRLFR